MYEPMKEHMKASTKKAVVVAMKGSPTIYVIESGNQQYIVNGHLLVAGTREDIENILVAMKILPRGEGTYTKVGKEYSHETGRTPKLEAIIKKALSGSYPVEETPVLLIDEDDFTRVVISNEKTILINDLYYTVLVAIAKDTMGGLVADAPNDPLRVIKEGQVLALAMPISFMLQKKLEYFTLFAQVAKGFKSKKRR